MKKNQYDFIILYRKQEIVLIVGNAQKTWFKQWKTKQRNKHLKSKIILFFNPLQN